MSNKHNPFIRLFTRDIEGSPKINALSMAASGLYFRLLNRFNEPPKPGSLALHEWEVHNNWKRSLTQQCLACPSETGRLVYFAKFLSKVLQWKSADILKSLQELHFFGMIRVEDDRLIQPRMYRDNGYCLNDDNSENAEIDEATGAEIKTSDMTEKITSDDDNNNARNSQKKSAQKNAQKTAKKSTDKNTTTHARGRSMSNENEIYIEDNNVIDKRKTEINARRKKQSGPTFDDFWNLYDKKCERIKSEALWAKLSRKDREAIMVYIPQYIEAQPEKRFRKNPTTFLRNRSWEDEIISTSTVPTKARSAAPAATGESVQATEPRHGKYRKW